MYYEVLKLLSITSSDKLSTIKYNLYDKLFLYLVFRININLYTSIIKYVLLI